jgi:hypothetical protein
VTRRLIAGLTGMALAAIVATSAFAYIGGVPSTVDAKAPSTATSGKPFTVSSVVIGQPNIPPTPSPAGQGGTGVTAAASGDVPLAGVTVEWKAVATSGTVTLSPTSSDTNASGVATTTATVVCDSCTVTFTATADLANGTAVVKVTGAGLPNTAASSGFSGSLLATILAVFAIIAGALLMVRQVVVARR